MVGAIVVNNQKVIGEGFHKKYGESHAEVNALKSVPKKDFELISESTLYVSLEPCCIYGNTPPCTKLIIDHKIPKVVVSNVDTTPEVTGNGLAKLRNNNVEVTENLLMERGAFLSNYRNTYTSKKRPYVILKYAKSKDGFLGKPDEQVWLTNEFSKRLVHKWRSETDAVMVGTNTVLVDNPKLTTRYGFGRSPKRIVIDRENRLSSNLNIFSQDAETILFSKNETKSKNQSLKNIILKRFDISDILLELAHLKITSIIVEGGAKIIDSFLKSNLWDEARIFTTPHLIEKGIIAPTIDIKPKKSIKIDQDILEVFVNPSI